MIKNIKKKIAKSNKKEVEGSTMYSKEFGKLTSTIWENVTNGQAHLITDQLAKLERKILIDNKKKRDSIRDVIDETRDKLKEMGKQLRD